MAEHLTRSLKDNSINEYFIIDLKIKIIFFFNNILHIILIKILNFQTNFKSNF